MPRARPLAGEPLPELPRQQASWAKLELSSPTNTAPVQRSSRKKESGFSVSLCTP